MWKALNKVGQTFIAAMFGLAVVSLTAFALTIPPTYAPRQFQTQQVHYFRIFVTALTGTAAAVGPTVNGYACGVLTTGVCVVKVGALPPNAFVLRINMQIFTNFNSASGTDQIGIGTSTSSAAPTVAVNLLAATSVHTGAGGNVSQTVVTANAGSTLTGASQAQFGQNGGQDLWVEFNNSSGNGPSAGAATLIVEYIAGNDGSCVDTPLGSTPTNC
jgi:hypothetical protein